MSGPTVKDLAGRTDPNKRTLAGLVRRMAVVATTRILWRLTGVRGLEGDTEELDVEVFPGVGIYARPAANGRPEAIVVNVGNAKLPVIVATRDEAGARAVREELGSGKPGPGETLVFASSGGAVVYLRADGTVEIRTASGVAGALATQAEVKALRDWVATRPYGGTGSAPVPGCPDITGTTVLKGE